MHQIIARLLYARHHKLLLIRSRSWIQAIHKDRIFWKKKHLKNKEMVFENGVKNIQATGYNGTRTVYKFVYIFVWGSYSSFILHAHHGRLSGYPQIL